MKKKPVIVLTGCTGSGKSDLVYNLADTAKIEIIGCDSRQVYRDMSIGTALPSKQNLARFQHHLVSFLDVNESFSAGSFVKLSKELIRQIHQRGNLPIIVGGTFFYIKSLWDGLIEEPDVPDELKTLVSGKSVGTIKKELLSVDPVSARRINSNDEYRLRRALLMSLAAGKPFSSFERSGATWQEYDFIPLWLDIPRKEIYYRINSRTKQMFNTGLLEETAQLLEAGYTDESPGLNSIGYKEILQFMNDKKLEPDHLLSLEDSAITALVELVAKNTRHYAKRQLTWFRHENRLKTIDHSYSFSLLSEITGNYI